MDGMIPCRGAAWRLARGVYIGWAEPLASISRCFPFNSVHNLVSQYLFSQGRNQQFYGLLRPPFHSLEIIPSQFIDGQQPQVACSKAFL